MAQLRKKNVWIFIVFKSANIIELIFVLYCTEKILIIELSCKKSIWFYDQTNRSWNSIMGISLCWNYDERAPLRLWNRMEAHLSEDKSSVLSFIFLFPWTPSRSKRFSIAFFQTTSFFLHSSYFLPSVVIRLTI